MKEELIRIEHGVFSSDTGEYRFDISVSCGECIGVYVDEYLTSGTAYLDLFKGRLCTDGRTRLRCGSKTGAAVIEHWIRRTPCWWTNPALRAGADHARFLCWRLAERPHTPAEEPQCGTAEIALPRPICCGSLGWSIRGDAPCRPFGAGLLPAFGVPRMVHRLPGCSSSIG